MEGMTSTIVTHVEQESSGSILVEYIVSDRDVVISDNNTTSGTGTNRLLRDLVALHHQLGNTREEALEKITNRLVNVIHVGIEGVACLQGKGVFAKSSNGSLHLATHEDAVHFVKMMLTEERKNPIEQLEDDERALSSENQLEESTRAQLNSDCAAEARGAEQRIMPRDYDVTIGDHVHFHGNLNFQAYVNHYIALGKVTMMSTPQSRVKAAILSLRRTKTIPNESRCACFMRRNDNDIWTVLDDDEAAEFVLCYVVDTLGSQSPVQTLPSSEESKSLISSIGVTDLSQFSEFSKPSTIPVRTPFEFDVLFGRGGMTNSHPGNKRFRDIISLHRPDYVRAIKIEKPNVARRIVAAIRGGDPPGRFMKRNPVNQMWYDVGNRHATEKTSQALREKSQSEKNGMNAGTSEADIRKRLLEQALSEARATRARLSKEGSGQIGDCFDPTTFNLLVPVKDLVSVHVSKTDAELKKSSNELVAEENNGGKREVDQSETDGAMLKNSIRDDLGKNAIACEEISPTSSFGLVDKHGDIIVTENDILCGRGGLTNHHRGNKRFRDVVALHRPDYVRAAKVNKPAVARMIVRAIRNSDPPGRFLRKDIVTNKWIDIGDKRAAEKASQALREKPPEERTSQRQGIEDVTRSNSISNRRDRPIETRCGNQTTNSSKNRRKEQNSKEDRSNSLMEEAVDACNHPTAESDMRIESTCETVSL